MGFNPIAAAIPVFFVCIGVEVAVARWRGARVIRFNDAIADLSCGITSQMAGLFTKLASAGAYVAAWSTLRITELPDDHGATWVFAFIAVDFAYYLWHRWTHSSGIGWASHVVHHQSEDYNLAVALRQSMTSSLMSWPFYLPLAVIGVSPLVALTCMALNTLYQFWIHTELIDRLGPLERVLNTPSHHRVHHGINERYLDKNHAGVFIVWDRLFGTFEPEGERPVYGTTTPLRSFNPLWANLAFFGTLLRATAAGRTLSDRLAVWWRGPGVAESLAFGAAKPPPRVEKYDPPTSPWVTGWIAVNFVPVAALTTWVIHASESAPLSTLVAPAAWIALSTVVWGGLLERRGWAWPLEAVRVPLGGALVAGWLAG